MTKRRGLLVASVITAAMLIGACGNDDGGGGSDPSPTTAAPTTTAGGGGGDTTTTAAPEPAADEFDPTATFTYGEAALTSLDPHLARTLYDNTYLYPVFDRLIHYDEDGNLEPGLATEWGFVDGGAAFELTLRSGVTFHDGTPFDASAVVANLDRGRTKEGSQVANELAVIDTVEAIGADKVRITLKGPAAPLPLFLADRSGMMMSPATMNNADVDKNPVGTGMYSFVRFADGELVEFQRNADYWNPDDVKNERLVIRILQDDATRLNTLKAGDLDATWVDESAVQSLEGSGIKVDVKSKLGLFHLQLNRALAPMDNTLVRRAINHAIDREGITEGVLFGLAVPTVQPMPPGNAGHNPDLDLSDVPYDPDLARSLLAEAGFSNGVSFTCLVINTSGYQARAEAVQAMLAEVGIDMQLQLIAGGEIIPKFYQNQEAPCAATPFGGRLDPSQTIGLMFTDTGFLNPGKGTTPRIMEIHQAALAELDQNKRIELFREFSQIYVDEALNVPLHYMSFPFAYQENVLGTERMFDVRPFDIRGIGVRAG